MSQVAPRLRIIVRELQQYDMVVDSEEIIVNILVYFTRRWESDVHEP
jgi:hypothetical protein